MDKQFEQKVKPEEQKRHLQFEQKVKPEEQKRHLQ